MYGSILSHKNCLIILCMLLGLTTQPTISQSYWDAFLGITSIWQHCAISQIETQDLIFLVNPALLHIDFWSNHLYLDDHQERVEGL